MVDVTVLPTLGVIQLDIYNLHLSSAQNYADPTSEMILQELHRVLYHVYIAYRLRDNGFHKITLRPISSLVGQPILILQR